ncbi:hypothetical protein [Aestuariivivens insulae]|uniref:hypothetical protein n=1 Tax=Aestuariivivens insulae TaxID=1621988 RepID=UPI001F592AC1|nr:hypothetical protein [Aestuariivivens insulae]
MILNDKQSLLLCGVLAAGLFVTGIFNILDNFIVLTILVLIFLIIIANIIYTKSKHFEEDLNDSQEKNSQ